MAFSRGTRVHPEPSSKLLSNFTNGLMASIPTVCDTMIREARNVILRKLSANEKQYFSYSTKMSNSATIDFRNLVFSPRKWLKSWEEADSRRMGTPFKFCFGHCRSRSLLSTKRMRQHSPTFLVNLYDVHTIKRK